MLASCSSALIIALVTSTSKCAKFALNLLFSHTKVLRSNLTHGMTTESVRAIMIRECQNGSRATIADLYQKVVERHSGF